MGIQTLLAYSAIYLLWGGAYLAMRVLVIFLPPFLVAGTRYSLAALCLTAILLVLKTPTVTLRQMLNAAWTGVILLTIAYGVIFWAAQHLSSWMVAVLMSTAFLWTYLGESLVLRSYAFRLSMLPPLLIGLAGTSLVVGGTSHGGEYTLIAAIAVLACALCWSAGSLAIKRIDMPASALRTTQIQLTVSGALLLVVSAANGEWRTLPPITRIFSVQPMLAMFFLVAGGSIVALAAFHWLLAHQPASLVSTSAYANPLVALIVGVLVAHEHGSRAQWSGAAIVLLSIVAIWRFQFNRDWLKTAKYRSQREAWTRSNAEPVMMCDIRE